MTPRRVAIVEVSAVDAVVRREAGPSAWRLIRAGVALALVFGGGTAGYYVLGAGAWSWRDALYMTVITLTTVGYSEVLPVHGHPDRELFTMVLLFIGMGTLFYFATALAAYVIEGDWAGLMWRRRVERRLAQLQGHIVACGVGDTGSVAVTELLGRGERVVGIDTSTERLELLAAQLGGAAERFTGIVGDATEERVLERAGITRARGLLAMLSDDRDNLYVGITARQMNPSLRIVARATGDPRKMRRAGVDAVVELNEIGGHRLVSELLRPQVTDFIRSLLLERGAFRLEEVVVGQDGPLVGRAVGEVNLRDRADVLIAAARLPDAAAFTYAPGAELVLDPGVVLIVMGPAPEVRRLRELVGAA